MNSEVPVIDPDCLREINNRILKEYRGCCDQNAKLPANHPAFDHPSFKRPPLFYLGNLLKKSILFIGLNPSFHGKSLKRYFDSVHQCASEEIKSPGYKIEDVFERWCKEGCIEENVPCLQELERLAKSGVEGSNAYPYYNKFKVIAERIGLDLPWDHIDLFFLRETKQDKLRTAVFENPKTDSLELNACGRAQLGIALDLLKCLEPKVIVVANALASRIIGNEFAKNGSGYDLKFHSCCGYHTIRLNNKRVPIFFSSMLSGQRALDLCSLERLIWHIQLALKNDGKHESYDGLTINACLGELEL